MKFLIVDDFDIKVEKIKLVIHETITILPGDIVVAQTVSDATSLLMQLNSVDLMILDLNLPVRKGEDIKALSGMNVIREITRRPNITRPAQIIGLTAHFPLNEEAVRFFAQEGWSLIRYRGNITDWEVTVANKINYLRSLNPIIKSKRKILLIGSAPKNLAGLNTGTEHRLIVDAIKRSTQRDDFDLIIRTGAMFEILSQEMLINRPEFMHISGHGDHEGITLENKEGFLSYVPVNALEQLFAAAGGNTKCILLCSCYSAEQARVISQQNIHVIGMNNSIDDNFAEDFSVGFYQAIGEATDIQTAFRVGRAFLLSKYPNQEYNPILWHNGNVIN